MRYGAIKKTDIANGDGVRVSIWVSGCERRCKGCFNPETWSFEYGEIFTGQTLKEISEALNKNYISGLTILGGEPLDPHNLPAVTTMIETIKFLYPDKTVWLYTGYKYKEVKDLKVMDLIDVLVDGEFIEDQKDISLNFRGSKNQRIINLREVRINEKNRF